MENRGRLHRISIAFGSGEMVVRNRRLEKGLLALTLTISLLLRLAALHVFLTVDEATWRNRSLGFYDALVQRDFGATYQSEHPGVTAMWIGAAAIRISQTVGDANPSTQLGRKMRDALGGPGSPTFPEITFWARRLVAFVTWLGILVLYPLLRLAFGRKTALIATALVALDPFYLAHSRLHHLDALLTTFTMLSVVSLLAYRRGGGRWRHLVLSASAGGLAMATKSPGVLVAPWALLVLGLGADWGRTPDRRSGLLHPAKAMFCWCTVAACVVVAMWPALWVDAQGTVEQVIASTLNQALKPHPYSNFFWFDIRADPGPGFYPVAWAFRTTPWVMAGLIALAVGGRKPVVRGRIVKLLLFILAYGGLVATSPKKFDRYLLPVFPLIDILAGVGCTKAFAGSKLSPRWKGIAPALLTVIVGLTQFALIWPARPYYLAYYNPFVGGTRVAPQIMLVGWGEGLEKAAAYLNEKPNARDLRVTLRGPAIPQNYTLEPFFLGHVVGGGCAPLVETDYFVLYANHVQRRLFPQVQEHFYGVESPEYVASVNGLDYAWVYRNTFYRQEIAKVLECIENQGGSQGDVVVLNTNAAFRRHYEGRLSLSVVAGPARDDFVLNALERALTGRHRVWFLTFPRACAAMAEVIRHHLEKRATATQAIVVGGVRAVRYDLPDRVCFVQRDPEYRLGLCLGDRIRLLGYDLRDTQLARGDVLSIRFYYDAIGPTDISYTVFTHLLGPDGELYGQLDSVPQGGARPTTSWLAGEIVLDDYKIKIAQDAPPGEYVLAVGMYNLDTMDRLPVFDQNGQRLTEDRILLRGFLLP